MPEQDVPLHGLDPAEEYRLQLLDRYDILEMPPDPSLSRIAQAAATLSQSTVGLVSVVDRDQLVFKAGADDLPCKTLPRRSSLCDAAIQVNARFEVPDVKADSRFQVYWQPEHPMAGQVVSYAGVPLRTPEGPILGMLCVIGNRTRRLESGQWKALEVLADSAMSVLEARSHAVRSLRNIGAMIDSLSSEVLLLDAEDLRALYGNAGIARRLACSPAELSGLQVHDLFPPEVCQQLRQARTTLLADNAATVPIEYRLRRAEGSPYYAKGSVQLRGWQSRRALILITNDVSELTLERDARASAQAANLAKTEFLARVSHELRTPLNAVLGFSQLLLTNRDEPLSRHQEHHLETIRHAGWHLLALIDDVLDISRIESGRLTVEPAAVALRTMLDDVLVLVGAQAQAAGVHIEACYRDQPALQAWADPVRLRQVVLNFLTNAVKYNRSGGSVRVDVSSSRGHVLLSIEDTGLGMTSEQLAHLFEPFNRLGREHGKIEGTGIGLALAHQLIELMGGRVHVESEVGRGTAVHLRLPAAGAEKPQQPVPADEAGTALDRDPEGMLLYIDDDPASQLIFEHFVARWGTLRLESAHSGRLGMTLIRSLRPDLILLNAHLPDLSGLQMLELMAADDTLPRQRVVMVSADRGQEDEQIALHAGAIAYWTKPMDLGHVGRELRRLMAPG